MSKNTYLVFEGRPAMNIRNFYSRNASRLRRRLSRLGGAHIVDRPNGRRYVFTDAQVVHRGTVKRDAERYAKRVGGYMQTLMS